MVKLTRKGKTAVVEFCDRCAGVCDAACRAEASLRATRLAALATYGWRVA